MAWNVIRKAGEEEQSVLDEKAREFARRHTLPVPVESEFDLWFALSDREAYANGGDVAKQKYLMRLWGRVASRAMRLPERGPVPGIAYGYVGYSCQ